MNAGRTLDQGVRVPTYVLTCGGVAMPESLRSLPGAVVGERPGKSEVDPHVSGTTRLIVLGGPGNPDADLAAVLTRLLRLDRLDVELAYVAPHPTPATRLWKLPTGDRAARLAVHGSARALPLVRDDAGQALVGQATMTGADGVPITGETYVDSTLLFSGNTQKVLIEPTAEGPGVRAGLPRRWRTHWVPGRAIQTGSTGLVLTRDGVPHERVTKRSTFYRHTTDWLLVV
jgi:hypothetical protein